MKQKLIEDVKFAFENIEAWVEARDGTPEADENALRNISLIAKKTLLKLK